MFNLFQKITESGLDVVTKNTGEIIPLQWVELLLLNPEFEEIVPWEVFDGEAWCVLLRESPRLAMKRMEETSWKKLSKRRKKILARLCPELEIPQINSYSGLDKEPDLIQKETPLKHSKSDYGFLGRHPRTGVTVSGAINFGALLKTLQCDYDDNSFPFVCGCGDARCHGLWVETVRRAKTLVHWSIQQYDNKVELYYDRDSYEQDMVEMLCDLEAQMHWHLFTCLGDISFSDFRKSFHELLEKEPRLNKIYAKLKKKELCRSPEDSELYE
jgi:hypothetical protein